MKRLWILVLAVLLSGCVTMGEKKPIDYTSVFAKAGLNIDTNSNDKADVPYGGTDAGTFTDGGILLGAGTGAVEVTALGAVGGILYGTGVNPAWLAAGATGKMLIAKGAAAPEWTPYTFPATVPTVGKVLISDGTNLIGSTALGTGAYATIADYAPLASPTFTGTVTIPTPFTIGAVSMTATGTQLNYVDFTSSGQTQLDARALESIVGTSLNALDLVNTGGVLETVSTIPHTNTVETVTYPWTFEGQRITVKTAAPTDPLPGWEGWADSDTWDPTGQGLSVPVKVTLTRDTTELFDDSENQDFTAGGGQWADGDLGTTFDSTTDLSLASDAADQYCELAVAEAPTTIGQRYRLTYDLDTLTGSWIIKDFTGAQTIGTISATATQGYLDWVATTTGGFRIVSGATVSIGNFDNFTLNLLPYKAIRDQSGNVYFATIQAAMKVNTDPNDISLTAAQMNAVIVITGAGEVTIPDGECDTATGQWITVKQTGAYAVDISFSGTDVGYLVDGTEVEGTNEIQTAGASGNQVTLMCIVAKQWWVTGEIGTSTEEAAD